MKYSPLTYLSYWLVDLSLGHLRQSRNPATASEGFYKGRWRWVVALGHSLDNVSAPLGVVSRTELRLFSYWGCLVWPVPECECSCCVGLVSHSLDLIKTWFTCVISCHRQCARRIECKRRCGSAYYYFFICWCYHAQQRERQLHICVLKCGIHQLSW